jgi:hypothetical protein
VTELASLIDSAATLHEIEFEIGAYKTTMTAREVT